MPDIPLESQEQIRQFNEEQARKEALKKAANPTKEKEVKRLSPGSKSKEVIQFVNSCGLEIITGKGKHPKILAPNGEKISVPIHGGEYGYAPGTIRSIEKFCLRNKP